jgi:FtsZ-binding cell division protein ZapB
VGERVFHVPTASYGIVRRDANAEEGTSGFRNVTVQFDGDKNEMEAFATNLRIVDNAPVDHRALADSLLRQAELMAEATTRADDDDREPWHKQTRMLAELAAVHTMLIDVPSFDELDRLRELNSEQVAEVVELRREVNRLDTENAELRSSVSELERENAALRSERDRRELRARANLTAANTRIDAQGARIGELEAELREVSNPNTAQRYWSHRSPVQPSKKITILKAINAKLYLIRCPNNPTRWYWSDMPRASADHHDGANCGSWQTIIDRRKDLVLLPYPITEVHHGK